MESFSAASQWVVVIFMVLAGMNFALLYRLLVRRKVRVAARDEEARLYLAILGAMSLLLTVELWHKGLEDGEAAFRHATFQVVSMMTTTGYASTDFILWPAFALMIVIGVMFVGGSAGSTGRLPPGRCWHLPPR